ncbi:MAG TPA: response regulator [Ignavibacteriales bacterium]|nr:response regulator [Ignavibacteriales bacterium]HOL81008.1 response regulator [Ignavibacteriales bacterium]HOM64744.1 response regulator [Ignavibacteriales bacterium]HPD66724.1 response regulator [Ignavibacteriales bacterium]HPP32788.1 response regulator [Ignavibacteriales bacterium]
MRFLIIEDDTTAQLLLKQIISNYGNYDIASNGVEAYELINSHDYDYYNIIFLDIMMPEMDGIEFLEKLRNYEKNNSLKSKKVIIISALDAQKTIIPKFINDEALTYLTKPINKNIISEIIENYINNL